MEFCAVRFISSSSPNFSGNNSTSRISTRHRGSSSSRYFPCTEACISTGSPTSVSYQKFVDSALEETRLRAALLPSPLQESFSSIKALDGTTELQMLAFEAPKIRLIRSLNIDAGGSYKVLDFAAFPKPEYDLPIFCANFFTSSTTNIIVLDLNPLYDVITQRDYKEKYYKTLMPLGQKYAELLPWGGKLTGESLRFFSPIVLWTKFTSTPEMNTVLYSAFMDYYKAWLDLMEQTVEEMDASKVIYHREAQHKYLTWRVQKDPGQRLLYKLVGETRSKELLTKFLFDGVNELGVKTFLDYFPEYRCEDGTVNERRSIIGKSFENRPWDERGEFIGTATM